MSSNIEELKRRMEGALSALSHDFQGLRTGRASVSLLDGIQVEAYGSFMPLNQMASVSAPEARLLTVQVWDKGNVKSVEKAIANAGLGLNPMADGQLIRVPLPELSEERRKELTKVGAKFAENARVAVRNVRRDGMDALKKDEKDKVISEDEHKKKSEEVQKITDLYIKKIDDALAQKEKDIMQV